MTTSQTTNNNGEIISEKKSQLVNKRLRFGDVFLLIVGYFVINAIVFSLIKIAINSHITSPHVNQTSAIVLDFSKPSDFYPVAPRELSSPKIIIEPQSKPTQTTDHLIVQLLSSNKKPLIILLVFICAVISAPLAEEFLYRGVLTGWIFESAKVYLPQFGFENKTSIASTIVALGFPALYFALLHGGNRNLANDDLIHLIITALLSNFIILFVGIFYLTRVRNFTPDQIGLRMVKMRFDILIAVPISVFAIPLLFMLTTYCKTIFPDTVIDPFPIFFFAILLGTIFIITRRLLPCIIIHALLNAVSFMVIMRYGA
ncbi:MAG: CPBP family intramembrane metalloprotease [Planctomycetaceae bacterium]|jgi:membrane protease YdiL (CAAX protease family)|nr:CPBP family intramembrane metalloprotease [Planctomycetaceae bacterium]